MRKRPRSSVTTILANFVGRSVVSAITQTPASGPLAPVTTPPRSPAPIVTAALFPWACAPDGAIIAAAMHAADAAMARFFISFEDIAERPFPVSAAVYAD